MFSYQSVSNVTQKVMDHSEIFPELTPKGPGTTHKILGLIQQERRTTHRPAVPSSNPLLYLTDGWPRTAAPLQLNHMHCKLNAHTQISPFCGKRVIEGTQSCIWWTDIYLEKYWKLELNRECGGNRSPWQRSVLSECSSSINFWKGRPLPQSTS